MNCSAQRFAKTGCNQDEMKIFVADLPEEVQLLLNQRINAEMRNKTVQNLPLQTICKWHEEEFLSKYEDFQKDITGCCCPFQSGVIHARYSNLQTVTLEAELQHRREYPQLLQGRQLCAECYVTLKSLSPSYIPPKASESTTKSPFSEPFVEQEVQDLYLRCVVTHGLIMEPSLKSLQAKAVHSILLQKDVLCVLATNYGKTLIQVVPSFLVWKTECRSSITLIVSPLSVLMDEFHQKITNWRLKSFIVADNQDLVQEIRAAADDPIKCAIYLLCSPEVLQKQCIRRLLGAISIDFIMVDECHTAVSWAENFRRDFGKLHEIRQVSTAPLSLFTATLTNDMVTKLILNTGIMKENMISITDTPNRPEIFLELRQKKGMDIDLEILRQEYMSNKKLQKTLFFIDSVAKTHEYNITFRGMIPNMGKNESGAYISEHFSSATEQEARTRIMKDFADKDGHIQVLFSTVSYGMGIDNKTIRRVIINELGKDSNELWQKCGRACRDGSDGTAILMSRGISHRDIIIRDVCIRHSILRKLVGYQQLQTQEECDCLSKTEPCKCYLCTCCSVCRKRCKCVTPVPHRESWRTTHDDSDRGSDSDDSLDHDSDRDEFSSSLSSSEEE